MYIHVFEYDIYICTYCIYKRLHMYKNINMFINMYGFENEPIFFKYVSIYIYIFFSKSDRYNIYFYFYSQDTYFIRTTWLFITFLFSFSEVGRCGLPCPCGEDALQLSSLGIGIHRWNSHGSWRCNAMGVDDIHSLKKLTYFLNIMCGWETLLLSYWGPVNFSGANSLLSFGRVSYNYLSLCTIPFTAASFFYGF